MTTIFPRGRVAAAAAGMLQNSDPESMFAENLVEMKHHQQMRSRRRGFLDRDLKPSPDIRCKPSPIPPHPLSLPLPCCALGLLSRC